MDFFRLNNGREVPCLCFGPGMFTRGFKYPDSFLRKIQYRINYAIYARTFYNAVLSAINIGYRFIDYSAAYGREDLISKAMQESGISRENFVLTTRITNQAQFNGNVREVFYKSLEKYKVDYVDLLMFHWPVTDKYIDTYKEMILLQKEGLCKSIGVSNCHSHHLEKLIQETGITPAINQVEIHPLLTQKDLLIYCKKQNIQLEAYTPLARMDERMVRLPKMKSLSKKYNKSITQLVLRWHVQNGIIPVFRSFNAARQKENIEIFDFKIEEEDIKLIDSININSRLRYDPDNCDFTIL